MSRAQTAVSRERLFKVLLAPHVSEKSSLAADQSDRVAFRVVKDATKAEIKAAVEMLFEVDVKGVSVTNVKGKSSASVASRVSARIGKKPMSDWAKVKTSTLSVANDQAPVCRRG